MLNAFLSLPLSSNRSQQDLCLESTLRSLSLHDCQIEYHQLGWEVTQTLKANPLLPGVILMKQGQFAGMISRRRFLEYMSRPYGLELFSKRPIECLYRSAETETLILNGDTLIVAAARHSLQRAAELLYEPIVVEVAPQVYRLLDVHELLIAQSQIHELATELLTQLYTHLEAANQQLLRLATSDGLTGVANRHRFDSYLDSCWHQMQASNSALSLILCDVDFFKKYNDTYGHQAGDDTLRQVAGAIQQAVQRPEDLVARYGGEEFAVILPHTSLEGALQVAERIRLTVKALKIAHVCSEVSECITLSLGVATIFPSSNFLPAMLIAAADEKLYQAKQTGRDKAEGHLLCVPRDRSSVFEPSATS
ncbi:diguanylate cyclase [Coleofasciculus sp. FACHB-SPT9]|uniref:diguanylate cyclase domain-containing protein n=1 Tax=Cyanophyceae TaxID=3028117 RepID=UPI0016843B09|nr:diguanylate cyclase [Coleofasciculus sp. FACHB-SPT9]